tara:strand:+ start:1376 stop:2293 length:918 start_codon:yes stop_codon:yes gene_type:complete
MKRLKTIYKKLFSLTICLLVITNSLFCQKFRYTENTELGILAGGSYYLGDLNTLHFNQTLPFAGLVIRKNIDRRISYKAQALLINLQSDERNSTDTFALNRGLHFSNNAFEENGSPLYELSGQIEFNFLPFQSGNVLYTWTPFLYTGVSIFHFNPKAENKNGEWISLQPLGTEGQGTTYSFDGEVREKYSLIQISIPMGGGIKYAVNEYFNIILEYSVRKTFTDYLDDVSKTYPGKNMIGAEEYPLDMSQQAIEMSDPKGTHFLDEQRGNPNKKDWYAFAGITLSFKLNSKNKECVERNKSWTEY